jgi:hypothetical protein
VLRAAAQRRRDVLLILSLCESAARVLLHMAKEVYVYSALVLFAIQLRRARLVHQLRKFARTPTGGSSAATDAFPCRLHCWDAAQDESESWEQAMLNYCTPLAELIFQLNIL